MILEELCGKTIKNVSAFGILAPEGLLFEFTDGTNIFIEAENLWAQELAVKMNVDAASFKKEVVIN